MAIVHDNLLETHLIGDDTHQWVVRGEDCSALRQRHISHVGVGDAAVPYRIVRTNLSGASFRATLGGEGRILLDGRWRPHKRGMTSLASAHTLHAFHAIPSQRWQYCWVRYTSESPRSKLGVLSPVIRAFDGEPVRHAIMGLVQEMQGAGDAANCVLWVDLIERYVDRFAEPWQDEKRLISLWAKVQADLAHAWTLKKLAGLAALSTEHLRRRCQRSMGRSPMQQLTVLRIQHAAHMLATTDEKIEAVAHSVGYQNPFAFSNTFKKITGMRPSSFRAHKRSGT